MHSKSVFLAAVAFIAVAGAEPDRPKIYFPRQVKRQFTNSTMTSDNVFAADPSVSDYSSTEQTTKRQTTSDPFNQLMPDLTSSRDSTTGQRTSSQEGFKGTSDYGSTGSTPIIVVRPTTNSVLFSYPSSDTTSPEQSIIIEDDKSTAPAFTQILVGPATIITGNPLVEPTPTDNAAGDVPALLMDSPDASGTGRNTRSFEARPISSASPPSSEARTVPSGSEGLTGPNSISNSGTGTYNTYEESTTEGIFPSSRTSGTGTASTAAATSPSQQPLPKPSNVNVPAPLSESSYATPKPPTETAAPNSTAVPPDDSNVDGVAPTLTPSTVVSSAATPSEAPGSEEPLEQLPSVVTSLFSEVLSSLSIALPSGLTSSPPEVLPSDIYSEEPPDIPIGTLTDAPIDTTASATSIDTDDSIGTPTDYPIDTTTDNATATATGPVSTLTGTTSNSTLVPIGNTSDGVTTTNYPSGVYPTEAPSQTSIDVSTTAPVTSVSLTVNATATESASASLSTQPGTDSSSEIIVTSTDPGPFIPTTALTRPPISSSITTGDSLAPTGPHNLPTSLPKALIPPQATQSPEVNTNEHTLIQICLKEAYSYDYITHEVRAASQIFDLTPKALAGGSGGEIKPDELVMHSIVPLDTKNQLGYVTSCALVYYPSDLVGTLRLDYRIANSPLYQSSDPLLYNFTSTFNNAIDIILGSTLGETGDGQINLNPGANAGNPGEAGGDPFSTFEDGDDKSASEKGTTAAVAVGAVGLAAAYGAVMFIVARRYKRKRRSHRHASSVSSPSDMRESVGSPVMRGGGAPLSQDFTAYGAGGPRPGTMYTATGTGTGTGTGTVTMPHGRDSHGSGRSGMNNSGRTAFISAPVAAENSLGWN